MFISDVIHVYLINYRLSFSRPHWLIIIRLFLIRISSQKMWTLIAIFTLNWLKLISRLLFNKFAIFCILNFLFTLILMLITVYLNIPFIYFKKLIHFFTFKNNFVINGTWNMEISITFFKISEAEKKNISSSDTYKIFNF